MQEKNIDYSEVYRSEEIKQLNKRLRKTKIVLFICAFVILAGATVFWMMKYSSFTTKNFLMYLGLSLVLAFLGLISKNKPYVALLTGLVVCIGFWAIEVVLNKSDDLLIEGSIQKLFIISLLASCLHTSKEAELIRKELHFS